MKELLKVAQAIYNAHGCGENALENLEREIAHDQDLSASAIKLAAWDMLSKVKQRHRRQIEQANYIPKTFTKEQQQIVQRACRGFYSWVMMDGSPLGKATKDHVLLDAARYNSNAKGNLKSSRFLEMVADKMDRDSQLVEEVWSEEKLAVLMAKAREAAGEMVG